MVYHPTKLRINECVFRRGRTHNAGMHKRLKCKTPSKTNLGCKPERRGGGPMNCPRETQTEEEIQCLDVLPRTLDYI